MNLVFSFGMYDHHYCASQQTECHPTPFAIVFPIVLKGESGTPEDQFGVGEIQAASFEGALSLGFMPSELHTCYYAYNRVHVNG